MLQGPFEVDGLYHRPYINYSVASLSDVVLFASFTLEFQINQGGRDFINFWKIFGVQF